MHNKEAVKEYLKWGCRVDGCGGRSRQPFFGLCWLHAMLIPPSVLTRAIAPGLEFEQRKELIDAAGLDLKLLAMKCDAESLLPGRVPLRFAYADSREGRCS